MVKTPVAVYFNLNENNKKREEKMIENEKGNCKLLHNVSYLHNYDGSRIKESFPKKETIKMKPK